MSHHVESDSAASWSRSLTPCPLLVEDCSTNQLVDIQPTNKPSLTTFVAFGVTRSSRHKQQETTVELTVRSASNMVEGLLSLKWVRFSFFMSHSLWASNPNPNEHLSGTQESTYSRHLARDQHRKKCSSNWLVTLLNQHWGSDCEPLTMQVTVSWYLMRNFYFCFSLPSGQTMSSR